MKYIVVLSDGFEGPIMFPDYFTHKEVAGNRKVVSAGFCDFTADQDGTIKGCAFGESTSLKLKSREEDSRLLTRLFNRY